METDNVSIALSYVLSDAVECKVKDERTRPIGGRDVTRRETKMSDGSGRPSPRENSLVLPLLIYACTCIIVENVLPQLGSP